MCPMEAIHIDYNHTLTRGRVVIHGIANNTVGQGVMTRGATVFTPDFKGRVVLDTIKSTSFSLAVHRNCTAVPRVDCHRTIRPPSRVAETAVTADLGAKRPLRRVAARSAVNPMRRAPLWVEKGLAVARLDSERHDGTSIALGLPQASGS